MCPSSMTDHDVSESGTIQSMVLIREGHSVDRGERTKYSSFTSQFSLVQSQNLCVNYYLSRRKLPISQIRVGEDEKKVTHFIARN